MKVYLVRHGEALMPNEDPLRPLSENGKQEVREIAHKIVTMDTGDIKKIYHSSKLRAKETAEIINAVLNVSGRVVEASGLLPDDEIETWYYRLSEQNEDIMLVGHLPFMPRLMSALIDKTTVTTFTTATIVCLEESNQKWSLAWAISP